MRRDTVNRLRDREYTTQSRHLHDVIRYIPLEGTSRRCEKGEST
jgi:hypothetical protein